MKYFLRKAFWGQKILALLDHELRKVINRNTVKASDSTMPNMEYNAKMWKKKMQRSGECSFKNLKLLILQCIWKKKSTKCFSHEDSSANTQSTTVEWRNAKKCNQCEYAFSRAGNLRRPLKKYNGEKSNKCNLCDFASSRSCHLRTHLKNTLEKSQTNVPSVTWHPSRQKNWPDIWKGTVHSVSIHTIRAFKSF